jgi:hypothetical protein
MAWYDYVVSPLYGATTSAGLTPSVGNLGETPGKKQQPAPPDFMGLAREMGQTSRDIAAEQTRANRPNVDTPFGGVRWTPPGDDGGLWGMEMYLTPEQQAALGSQQRVQAGRSQLAEDALGRARTELAGPMDFSNLPELGGAVSPEDMPEFDISGAPELPDVAGLRDRAEEAIYGRATARLDPEWSRRRESLDVELRNQGIFPGSEMYQRQMADLERARESAYAGARSDAVTGGGAEASRLYGMGLGARQQFVSEAGQRFGAGMQRAGTRFGQRMASSSYDTQRREAAMREALTRRGWSLNEANALMSGQQVGMPTMPGFSGASAGQAPNLLGAAGQQWAADLAKYGLTQAQIQGLLNGFGNFASLAFMA